MLEKTSEQRDNPEFMERVVKGTLATMFAGTYVNMIISG